MILQLRYLCIVLLLTATWAQAGPPVRPLEILTDVSLDIGGSDQLAGIVPIHEGYLLAGYSGSGGSSRPWLMRIDHKGEKLWCQMPDNLPWSDIVTFGSASDQAAFLSIEGFMVWKLNSDGNTIWHRNMGFGFQTHLVGDPDGGCVAAAVVDGGPGRGYDIRIVALNRSGDLRWEKQLGGNGSELGPRLAISAAGRILLAFGSTSLVNDNTPPGNPVGRIVSLDLAGEVMWQTELGPGWVYSLETDSVGGCWIGSGWQDPPAGFGSEDWLVSRVNPAGKRIWERIFGGSGQDRPMAMLRQGQDQVVIAGFSGSPISGNKFANRFGDHDYWCLKLDANGQAIWQAAYGGIGEDLPFSLVAATDGGFILGGRSSSKPSGNKRSPMISPYDVWLLHVAPDHVPSPSQGLALWPIEEFSPRRILSASGAAGTTFVLERSENLETWHPVSTNVFDAFDLKLELSSDAARPEHYRLVAE